MVKNKDLFYNIHKNEIFSFTRGLKQQQQQQQNKLTKNNNKKMGAWVGGGGVGE